MIYGLGVGVLLFFKELDGDLRTSKKCKCLAGGGGGGMITNVQLVNFEKLPDSDLVWIS